MLSVSCVNLFGRSARNISIDDAAGDVELSLSWSFGGRFVVFRVVDACCCTPELLDASSKIPVNLASMATKRIQHVNRRRGGQSLASNLSKI
jgi:hypothetical protein